VATARQTSVQTAVMQIWMATYPAGVKWAAGSSARIVRVTSERVYSGRTSRLAVIAKAVTTGQARRATVSQRDHQSGSAGPGRPASACAVTSAAMAPRARAIHLRRRASLNVSATGSLRPGAAAGRAAQNLPRATTAGNPLPTAPQISVHVRRTAL
jgi:hypothetical protein